LNIIVRQNKDQEEFRDLLAKTRIEKPSDTNVKTLMSLHLNSNEFSVDDIKAIEKKAMYVFANKKKKREFNDKRLKEQYSKTNPHCKIESSVYIPVYYI
jgi:hypothetical protein